MRKAIMVLLVLAAILLGAIYGHFSFLKQKGVVKSISDYIAYLTEGTERIPVDAQGKPITGAEKKTVAPADTAVRPDIRPTEVPTVQKIEKPKPAIDRDLVAALLRESVELYRKMNYKEAIEKSRQVASMLEKAGLEDSDLHRDALQIENRSRAFDALVSKIPPNVLSDGKGLQSIELDSGSILIVRVLREDPKTGAVTIQQNDGIQATFTEDQIRKRTPINHQDYVKKLTEELDRRIGKAKKDLYFDMFSLALFAIQNRLEDRVTELLEKTFAVDGSELAYETFYTGNDQSEMVALLLESFGRSDKAQSLRSRTAQPARFAELPEKSAPESPPETMDTPSVPDPLLEQIPESAEPSKTLALKYLAAGQDYARCATLNATERFRFGRNAKKYLEKAADILDRLIEQNPRDTELEQLRIQVGELLQHVNHNLVGVER